MLSPLPPSPRLDAFSNKRKAGPPSLPPSSKQQKLTPDDTAEEFEWDHDPVNIEILEPSEEAYVETKEFDKMTTNVFFLSPISTLTTDSEFSPVKVKSLCLKVSSKSENKQSQKIGEQKDKHSKNIEKEMNKKSQKPDCEEKAKQNKRKESEEKSEQSQKTKDEQKVKQSTNIENEEKMKSQKLENGQKTKPCKSLETETLAKQNEKLEAEEKPKQREKPKQSDKLENDIQPNCSVDTENIVKPSQSEEMEHYDESGKLEGNFGEAEEFWFQGSNS